MTTHTAGHRLHVVVIFGGRSGEHEVSVASARSVVAHLDAEKYDVTLVGITRDGRWVLPLDRDRALQDGPDAVEGLQVMLPVDHGSRRLLVVRDGAVEQGAPVDVVFPVLHGPYGEDGTVQGLLELAGLPYVGAGVLGSAVGMDKVVMKNLLQHAGLPVVDFHHFSADEWRQDHSGTADRACDWIGLPCFVKPANLGSSVGITKVHRELDLPAAIDLAAAYDVKILVERAVPNAREIECSVLGHDNPQPSMLGEIIPAGEFYSYEAKYVDDDSELVFPAQLPGDVEQVMRDMAVEAFRVLDCSGMARVDFLLRGDTNDVFLSEINTIPGFTKISMYPKLWEAGGLSYGALLDHLIEFALERHAQRAALKTTYD